MTGPGLSDRRSRETVGHAGDQDRLSQRPRQAVPREGGQFAHVWLAHEQLHANEGVPARPGQLEGLALKGRSHLGQPGHPCALVGIDQVHDLDRPRPADVSRTRTPAMMATRLAIATCTSPPT